MKKIASFVLFFTFMFITSQLAFSYDEYTFVKITEDEFEKAFDDKNRVTQIINSYLAQESLEVQEPWDCNIENDSFTIGEYHKLVIPYQGQVIFIEFTKELYPMQRYYLLELYYDFLNNFLDYKINCFDEPSKEPRFFPFKRKPNWDSIREN